MVRSNSVAAALAVLPDRDDTPRVIRQFTSIFLVSRLGELWRVYDTDARDGADRQMPDPHSRHPHRLFIALAHTEQVRLHSFADGESRDIEPSVLQRQLDASATV